MSFKDSDAVLIKGRMLTQHQAVLTLIQQQLDNPKLHKFKWLDIGCGRGQIIVNLKDNFTEATRAKISYKGYDVKDEFVGETLKIANSLGFDSCEGEIGTIHNYPKLISNDTEHDCITITNAIHEFSPKLISMVFVESILRLSPNGRLFIYDMESLPDLELGAVTWSAPEIQEILLTLFKEIPITNGYEPNVGKWFHKSCDAWHITLSMEYMEIDKSSLLKKRDSIIKKVTAKIKLLLKRKLKTCTTALKSLQEHGDETGTENQLKNKLLHDFWSLTNNQL